MAKKNTARESAIVKKLKEQSPPTSYTPPKKISPPTPSSPTSATKQTSQGGGGSSSQTTVTSTPTTQQPQQRYYSLSADQTLKQKQAEFYAGKTSTTGGTYGVAYGGKFYPTTNPKFEPQEYKRDLAKQQESKDLPPSQVFSEKARKQFNIQDVRGGGLTFETESQVGYRSGSGQVSIAPKVGSTGRDYGKTKVGPEFIETFKGQGNLPEEYSESFRERYNVRYDKSGDILFDVGEQTYQTRPNVGYVGGPKGEIGDPDSVSKVDTSLVPLYQKRQRAEPTGFFDKANEFIASRFTRKIPKDLILSFEEGIPEQKQGVPFTSIFTGKIPKDSTFKDFGKEGLISLTSNIRDYPLVPAVAYGKGYVVGSIFATAQSVGTAFPSTKPIITATSYGLLGLFAYKEGSDVYQQSKTQPFGRVAVTKAYTLGPMIAGASAGQSKALIITRPLSPVGSKEAYRFDFGMLEWQKYQATLYESQGTGGGV